jgi:hypothetical protein
LGNPLLKLVTSGSDQLIEHFGSLRVCTLKVFEGFLPEESPSRRCARALR